MSDPSDATSVPPGPSAIPHSVTPSLCPDLLGEGPNPTDDGNPSESHSSTSGVCLLLDLPSELITTILSYLSPLELIGVSETCRELREHALSDVLWHPLVQENVPDVTLTSPHPCNSYHELYVAHDRLWFLPRHKIWFCDRDLTGRVMLVRYDPRRGCIEGYQLLAARGRPDYFQWEGHPNVVIHDFNPQVRLHLDKPILQFHANVETDVSRFFSRPDANRYADEMPMALEDRVDGMFSNFMLAHELERDISDEMISGRFPYSQVWPPPAIPSDHRTRGQPNFVVTGLPFSAPYDRPKRRDEVSEKLFHIRQWMEMAGGMTRLGRAAGLTGIVNVLRELHPAAVGGLPGMHVGEELITYSTLDPKLYTPTPLKPWRGIYAGDYSTHGCEFLLVHQPDDDDDELLTDEALGIVRFEIESDQEWEKRKAVARTHRGRLEAIKLTGDPNVPRGEISFVAEDLGPGGFVGEANDPHFGGARIVNSKGHVSDTGFTSSSYIDGQLILVSHDRLAHHWIEFGHVSCFQRVDIDQFLSV
ncbi:hypothetical protein NW755_010404 [Fusarium falciforme]|uniref:F-box domain-containing protein n=1 Tax=Fusarium falciforme TaxID=195108 RepID=A0A9W8UXV3_9HYPO|nr:hypothetical protein NW755_010404 [Fusarium falciforme]KAJ4237570.1 hypothetical protein NW757_013219 [Fusarium falciforme]